jgi:hypothetical protein
MAVALVVPVVAVPVVVPIVAVMAAVIPIVGCVASPPVIAAIVIAIQIVPVVAIVIPVVTVVSIVPAVVPPPMIVVPVPPGGIEVDMRRHPAAATMPDRLLCLFLEYVLPYPVGHADLTSLDDAGRDPKRSPLLAGTRRQRREQAEQKRCEGDKGRVSWHDGAGPRSRPAPRP